MVAPLHHVIGQETTLAHVAEQLGPRSAVGGRAAGQEGHGLRLRKLAHSVVGFGIADGSRMPPRLVSEHGALLGQEEAQEKQKGRGGGGGGGHSRAQPHARLLLRTLNAGLRCNPLPGRAMADDNNTI